MHDTNPAPAAAPATAPNALSDHPRRPPVPLWKTRSTWFLTGVVAWSMVGAVFGAVFGAVWGHANVAQVAENCREFVRAYDGKMPAPSAPADDRR